MSKKDPDPLDGEVSIKARVDQSGLELGAKSRLVAALDRMLGAMADLPGGFFDGLADRQRARNAGRLEEIQAKNRTNSSAQEILDQGQLAVLEAQTRAAVERATQELISSSSTEQQLVLTQHARAVLLTSVRDVARDVTNKAAIAAEALELLEISDGAGTDPSDANGTEDEIPIGDDWLNFFADHAQRASSQHLRSLWAQILAGEVRKPGAFSLSTMRFVSELDQEVATVFEEHLVYLVGGNSLPRQENMEGEPLDKLLLLQEIGLVSGADAPLGRVMRLDDTGTAIILNEGHVLILKGDPGQRIQWPVASLTRVGREIAAILPKSDGSAGLVAVAQLLKESLKEMHLSVVTERAGDTVSYRSVRKLWPE